MIKWKSSLDGVLESEIKIGNFYYYILISKNDTKKSYYGEIWIGDATFPDDITNDYDTIDEVKNEIKKTLKYFFKEIKKDMSKCLK